MPRGVTYIQKTKKWRAVICVGSTRHSLGCFETKTEALIAYLNSRIRLLKSGELKNKIPFDLAEYLKTYHRKLKLNLIAAYGGKCECCGESDPGFLTVDHKHNDGYAHRKEISAGAGGHNIYVWLRDRGYPKDRFRLLCYNCNCARGHLGECPHETARRKAGYNK